MDSGKDVINATYRNTSMIRTMRERWNLGEPLTARDADAADIGPVLTLDRPRAPQDWPDVAPLPVPAFNETLIPLNQPLTPRAGARHGMPRAGPATRPNPATHQRPRRPQRCRGTRNHARNCPTAVAKTATLDVRIAGAGIVSATTHIKCRLGLAAASLSHFLRQPSIPNFMLGK